MVREPRGNVLAATRQREPGSAVTERFPLDLARGWSGLARRGLPRRGFAVEHLLGAIELELQAPDESGRHDARAAPLRFRPHLVVAAGTDAATIGAEGERDVR